MSNFFFTRIIFLSFLILSASILIFAQTPTATPSNEDNGDVVKISTTLIQIDATVTDKDGKQVTDLKPEDFEIYENGKKQTITNFSYISTSTDVKDSYYINSEKKWKRGESKQNALSAPTIAVKLPPEKVKRTFAFVVNDIGLGYAGFSKVKNSLEEFADRQMLEGDLVAIILTSGGSAVNQQFTADRNQLRAIIKNLRFNSTGTRIIYENPLASDNSFSRLIKNNNDNNTTNRGNISGIKTDPLERFRSLQQDAVTASAIQTLTYVVQGMKELPGRKSIVLYSQNLVLGEEKATEQFGMIRLLSDLANRSSVVINAINTNGLTVTTSVLSAEHAGTESFGKAVPSFLGSGRGSSIDGIAAVTEGTGGRYLSESNSLNTNLQRMLDDQNGYYLIGYEPDEATFNPNIQRFNDLKVKLNQKGLRLRYRNGFFGISDEELKKTEVPQTNLLKALLSPFESNQIGLSINPLFISPDQKNAILRSILRIDANNLDFVKQPNGNFQSSFDVLAVTFNSSGSPVEQIYKNFQFEFSEEGVEKVKKKGLIYNFIFPVKKTGAYQLRVALRDNSNKKIGAVNQFIEIPNVTDSKLVLSSLLLEGYPPQLWQKIAKGGKLESNETPDTFTDTSVRQFKRGEILKIACSIYNAKIGSATQKPQIFVQTKLFRNGQIIVENEPQLVDLKDQSDLKNIQITNALALKNDLQTGDYVLQIIVYDKLAKEKYQAASQAIDFEIIE